MTFEKLYFQLLIANSCLVSACLAQNHSHGEPKAEEILVSYHGTGTTRQEEVCGSDQRFTQPSCRDNNC